jgi:hypothetical protein
MPSVFFIAWISLDGSQQGHVTYSAFIPKELVDTNDPYEEIISHVTGAVEEKIGRRVVATAFNRINN